MIFYRFVQTISRNTAVCEDSTRKENIIALMSLVHLVNLSIISTNTAVSIDVLCPLGEVEQFGHLFISIKSNRAVIQRRMYAKMPSIPLDFHLGNCCCCFCHLIGLLSPKCQHRIWSNNLQSRSYFIVYCTM